MLLKIVLSIFFASSLLEYIDESNCPRSLYNIDTVETLRGRLVSQERVPEIEGLGHCVHYTLEQNGGSIKVILGPDWFVANQKVQIHKNEIVIIKGSRVRIKDAEVLIAAKVFAGDGVILLRDEYGTPLWSEWRHGEWLFDEM